MTVFSCVIQQEPADTLPFLLDGRIWWMEKSETELCVMVLAKLLCLSEHVSSFINISYDNHPVHVAQRYRVNRRKYMKAFISSKILLLCVWGAPRDPNKWCAFSKGIWPSMCTKAKQARSEWKLFNECIHIKQEILNKGFSSKRLLYGQMPIQIGSA